MDEEANSDGESYRQECKPRRPNIESPHAPLHSLNANCGAKSHLDWKVPVPVRGVKWNFGASLCIRCVAAGVDASCLIPNLSWGDVMVSIQPASSERAVRDLAPRVRAIGAFVLRYSLVFFLLFFGALKWTSAEAKGIEPMVSHSPFFFWLYPAVGVQTGSEVIGVIELAIACLIVVRRWAPRASAIGSIAASGMFVVTLSFLFTTPNIGEGAPFLLKDLTLLGAALWTAGEALEAARSRS
jgi:uncharacterized membrane protein YkgB